ncbi:MAG: hypothetical protein ACE5G1_02210, partial [bacterium]
SNMKPAFGYETWEKFHEWRNEHNLPDEADVFVLFLSCAGRPLPVLEEIREIGAEPTEVARIMSESHIIELFIYRDYLKFEAQSDDTKLVTDRKGNWYKKIYSPWGIDQAEYFKRWTKGKRLRQPSKDSELQKAAPFSVLIYELVEYLNPFLQRPYQNFLKEANLRLVGEFLKQCFPEWFSNVTPDQLKSRYYNTKYR